MLFTSTGASGQELNDTWEFDGVDWTELFPVNRPLGGQSLKMAYFPSLGSVVPTLPGHTST